jgi:hypothetical protein
MLSETPMFDWIPACAGMTGAGQDVLLWDQYPCSYPGRNLRDATQRFDRCGNG